MLEAPVPLSPVCATRRGAWTCTGRRHVAHLPRSLNRAALSCSAGRNPQRLENTSPLEAGTGFQIDHTVFLDNVTLCHLGTTTTTVTTSTTSTTATATTHTVLEDTRREVIELQSMMIVSQSAQSRMQSQMESMASRLAIAETVSTAVAAVDTRVTNLTNVRAP